MRPKYEPMNEDWAALAAKAMDDHDPELEPYASMTREQLQELMMSPGLDVYTVEAIHQHVLDKCSLAELERINFREKLATWLIEEKNTFGSEQALFTMSLAKDLNSPPTRPRRRVWSGGFWKDTIMRSPAPSQAAFSWSLTVNGGDPIPSKKIFGRRLLTAKTMSDIVPETTLFLGIDHMAVISAAALKGGAGKSTITHDLIGALGLTGRRILAIDADPQASLTTGALGTEGEQIPVDESVVMIYAGRDPLPSDLIRPSGIAGVDLIAGSWGLNSWNFPDPHLAPIETQARMRNFLDEVRGDYDLVVIDTPPNLYACCYGALTASDYCIIPTQPMNYDVRSLSHVFEVIRQVQAGPNPDLVNLGMVLNRTKRSGIHTGFDKTLRSVHPGLVFDATIPESVHIQEAILAMKPVTHYKPKCDSAKRYKALADEMLVKIVAHQATLLQEVEANV